MNVVKFKTQHKDKLISFLEGYGQINQNIFFVDFKFYDTYKEDGITICLVDKIEQTLKIHPKDYFLYNLDKEYLFNILETIDEKEIELKTTDLKFHRIKIKDINYINVEGRNITYHLIDETLTGPSIRKKFSETVVATDFGPHFTLVSPTIMVNTKNIDYYDKDKIVFKNKDEIYLPKNAYKKNKGSLKSYPFILLLHHNLKYVD